MRGLLEHFKITLLLNFRNRQAMVYGYLVPLFFLIAFAAIFRGALPPLIGQLGQILTISVLGGACFGMPTAMVAERERGVWRRFRLLPAATGSLVVSTMGARFLIVLSAAVMQIVLAMLMYGMPLPAHIGQMAASFVVVTFAFLGMGLVIAMLADAVPAVQALGQAIFLPMIIIGGVGVPLSVLPEWARHVARFLPGIYAVDALDACAVTNGGGLMGARFDLLALLAIGVAGCIAGGLMFRWDAHEKLEPRRRWWGFLALAVWLSVGLVAELSQPSTRVVSAPTQTSPAASTHAIATQTGSQGGPVELSAVSTDPAVDDSLYTTITPAQIDAITYNNLPDDTSTITPVAKSLDHLDAAGKARMAEFRRQLDDWPPGKDASLPRRVRNLLEVASVADIAIDQYEGADAYVVFEKLRHDVPREDLIKALAWLTLHPADEHPITTVPELGIEGEARPSQIRDRVEAYSAKLLGRLLGKIPETQP